MATQHEPPSSRNAMLVLVAGVLVVGGLVAWALTRTVEVAPSAPPSNAEVSVPATIETAARNTPPLATMPNTSTGPTPRPPEVHGDRHSVARMAPEDLKAKWARGEVTIIDVRDENSFKTAHIPGAMHIQFASIEGQIDTIPKGKQIVLYCT